MKEIVKIRCSGRNCKPPILTTNYTTIGFLIVWWIISWNFIIYAIISWRSTLPVKITRQNGMSWICLRFPEWIQPPIFRPPSHPSLPELPSAPWLCSDSSQLTPGLTGWHPTKGIEKWLLHRWKMVDMKWSIIAIKKAFKVGRIQVWDPSKVGKLEASS